jgi:hypothetical protein
MFPVGDWEFWLATLIALIGLAALARVLLPKRRGKSVDLTIEGEPKRKGGKDDCH